jgi:adenylate kinase family enzyme
MEKVLVIGSGGAGKTTVARDLAAVTGLPLVHLDRLYWHPGWVATPADQWQLVVQNIVARERWVIDGNYGGTMALRAAAADTVVFLDIPRTRCLARALKRGVAYRGRTRDDMPSGCPERITWGFVRWIWTYPAIRRPKVLAMLAEFEERGGRAAVLRSATDVREFLASIPSP